MAQDVREWLLSLRLGRLLEAFVENGVDGDLLAELSNDDLKDIGVTSLRDRKILLTAIERLRAENPFSAAISEHAVRSSSPTERRQLTVMFCDLVGSTALATTLDPEDMRTLLVRYQDLVSAVVARHAGYVANYLGDGFLSYFGWPRAREDQAECAVRAGLAVAAAMPTLSVPGQGTLAARTGIATGRVVVGDLQGESMRQFGAVAGETPNLAARLQAEAAANEVLIDASTRSLIGNAFELTELGDLKLKGIADLVRAFRVFREAKAESRFAAQHLEQLAPFVGRRSELALLVDKWETAAAGEGQVVVLSGEAGIGKSRLSQELLERIGGQPHVRLRYQCSPLHMNSAYYPIIRQLEHAAGFLPTDTSGQKVDKLEGLLRQNADEITTAAPLLAGLLSLPVGRYARKVLSPENEKQFILDALTRQLVGLSAANPVIILLEDAHWMDPTSLDAFQAVVERIESLPVLMLMTARNDFEPPWQFVGHVAKLSLTRLPKWDCGELVRRLGAGPDLPDDMIERIIARTDGIPLYVEEVAKGLRNHVAVETTFDIPASLQALFASRLDEVSSDARAIAQIGSVFGREFSFDPICSLSDRRPDEVKAALQELVASGLLSRRDSESGRFVFKHALIEEAAYSSQLKSVRFERHRAAARWYLANQPETAQTEPELIAQHLVNAGDDLAALPHLLAAGQLANARCAYSEAIAHLRTALDIARKNREVRSAKVLLVAILTTLGTSMMAQRGYSFREAGELFKEALELSEEAPATTLFQIIWNLWLFNVSSANLPEAAGCSSR